MSATTGSVSVWFAWFQVIKWVTGTVLALASDFVGYSDLFPPKAKIEKRKSVTASVSSCLGAADHGVGSLRGKASKLERY